MISFKSSSCFPLSSGANVDRPVMFPPGRAEAGDEPVGNRIVSCVMTMGIVEVASLAARVAPDQP